VKVPAYEMLRKDRGVGQHMLGALLRGISTREYQEVLPQMAATVGVSRSAISRKVIDASIEQLQQLQERLFICLPESESPAPASGATSLRN
jgi:transposase-like protein